MADTPQLVDLARTKSELKEEAQEAKLGYDGKPDPYAWGLNFRLESEELDKLGITTLPEVGSEYHLMVTAKVTSVNQSATVGQDDERCVGLTMTMMQILSQGSASEEKAEGKETPAMESAEYKKPRKGGMLGSY
jgi:hypothetical protein